MDIAPVESKEEKIQLSQGKLTAKQIDLMLKKLPLEVSFVDENDKVCYYTDSEERIFPRSPDVIGMLVQNCHPPKSVHIVEDILKNFKEKKKDFAEFWIPMNGKFVYISYYPLYDDNGEYKGVIETTRDISHLRSLQGERRILDW